MKICDQLLLLFLELAGGLRMFVRVPDAELDRPG